MKTQNGQHATRGDVVEMFCKRCSVEFSYTVRDGRPPSYCSTACCHIFNRERSAKVRQELRASARGSCLTLGCSRKVVFRVGAQLCEACYCHAWRTGRPSVIKLKEKGLRNKQTVHIPSRVTAPARVIARPELATPAIWRHGNYRVLRVPGHPLAHRKGHVYHHRLVAYGARDGVCGPCYWCGISLIWKTAKVDHLDDEKTNNVPENLVLACGTCNTWRGSLIQFARHIMPGRVDQMVALLRRQVDRQSALIAEAEAETMSRVNVG